MTKLFETHPAAGTVVFDLPIAFMGQVLDELVEHEEARTRILMFSVTPYNSTDVNSFECDAVKVAIHTPAVGVDAPTQMALLGFAELFHRVIAPLIHDCNEDDQT